MFNSKQVPELNTYMYTHIMLLAKFDIQCLWPFTNSAKYGWLRHLELATRAVCLLCFDIWTAARSMLSAKASSGRTPFQKIIL